MEAVLNVITPFTESLTGAVYISPSGILSVPSPLKRLFLQWKTPNLFLLQLSSLVLSFPLILLMAPSLSTYCCNLAYIHHNRIFHKPPCSYLLLVQKPHSECELSPISFIHRFTMSFSEYLLI